MEKILCKNTGAGDNYECQEATGRLVLAYADPRNQEKIPVSYTA